MKYTLIEQLLFSIKFPRDYSFGFNGKDRESEFNSGAYDFGARIHDARLGRWMSVDPYAISYPYWSGYASFNNNGIAVIDPTGKSGIVTNLYKDSNGQWHGQIHLNVAVYSDEYSQEQLQEMLDQGGLGDGFSQQGGFVYAKTNDGIVLVAIESISVNITITDMATAKSAIENEDPNEPSGQNYMYVHSTDGNRNAITGDAIQGSCIDGFQQSALGTGITNNERSRGLVLHELFHSISAYIFMGVLKYRAHSEHEESVMYPSNVNNSKIITQEDMFAIVHQVVTQSVKNNKGNLEAVTTLNWVFEIPDASFKDGIPPIVISCPIERGWLLGNENDRKILLLDE